MTEAEVALPLDLDLRFRVRRKSGAKLDRKRIRSVCEAALRGEGVHGPVVLTIALVDDDEIRRINQQHRGIDRATDVLSFPLVGSAEGDQDAGFALPPGVPRELGDVVVSYPRAVAQAHEYGHSVERELAYLIVHGVLHIMGHDHEDGDEQAVMRAREEAALLVAGLTRDAT
jgi:probable rRNA maturation factor